MMSVHVETSKSRYYMEVNKFYNIQYWLCFVVVGFSLYSSWDKHKSPRLWSMHYFSHLNAPQEPYKPSTGCLSASDMVQIKNNAYFHRDRFVLLKGLHEKKTTDWHIMKCIFISQSRHFYTI